MKIDGRCHCGYVTAEYVDRILKGAKPADLRCRTQFGSSFAIVAPLSDAAENLSWVGQTSMRALALAIALSLMIMPAPAASPHVEAGVKAFQTVGTDPKRLEMFCELMEVEEENEQKTDRFLQTKLDKVLDELGADFSAAWKSVEGIDPASDDGKVLYAALDRLLEKCSD
jgi:hypothetical protein